MITFKKFGKEIKISNKDWKKLKARFSPHNAVVGRDRYVIEKECPLCAKYNKRASDCCTGCPLDVFSTDWDNGCFVFFDKLFPKMKFRIGEDADISWDILEDLEARKQLYELEDIMAKIEDSQNK